jgi:hypothetical protein
MSHYRREKSNDAKHTVRVFVMFSCDLVSFLAVTGCWLSVVECCFLLSYVAVGVSCLLQMKRMFSVLKKDYKLALYRDLLVFRHEHLK